MTIYALYMIGNKQLMIDYIVKNLIEAVYMLYSAFRTVCYWIRK
jgi:hypothetical protein